MDTPAGLAVLLGAIVVFKIAMYLPAAMGSVHSSLGEKIGENWFRFVVFGSVSLFFGVLVLRAAIAEEHQLALFRWSFGVVGALMCAAGIGLLAAAYLRISALRSHLQVMRSARKR